MKLLMKSVAFAAALGAASLASAQSWPVYGGDTGNQRYSQGSQITPANVSKLNVKWALQLGSNRSQESSPILVGDTLYVTSSFGPKNVFAVNAKTGEVRWKWSPEMPKGVEQYACCDVNSRGVAYNDGKIFVGRLDAKVTALDAKTGKEMWTQTVVDYTQGSVITSPPVVAKNVIITGFGGGEYGVRGALVALDQSTGKEVWRTYTVPVGNEKNADTWKGDTGKTGGGAAWFIGS